MALTDKYNYTQGDGTITVLGVTITFLKRVTGFIFWNHGTGGTPLKPTAIGNGVEVTIIDGSDAVNFTVWPGRRIKYSGHDIQKIDVALTAAGEPNWETAAVR